MTLTLTRDALAQFDTQDPLAHCRERFILPDGVIYLDGNSLGVCPKSVPARMRLAIEKEWAQGLIRSWNDADWYLAPQRTGQKIAGLVGADADEVIVADSISVNLFKVLVAALRMRPERRLILSERGNFPTDVYISQGVAELMDIQLECLEPEQILEAIDERVAVVQLTHVNYKTGRLYDMQAITRRAHEKGALVLWDLAHTAGAMPCALNACEVDFAVGCGYKYLNGSPGAPAFVFVARRHQEAVRQPLTGWHGHAQPFDFTHDYQAGKGMDRMLVGTAPQMGVLALEEALKAFDGVDLHQLRNKSVRMTDLFIRLAEQELASHGFGLASPRESAQRGSQVALTHPQGYAIMQALIARGVIGDFRAPDILRFGFAVLYLRFVDVWDAITALKNIMDTQAWRAPEFMARKAVT